MEDDGRKSNKKMKTLFSSCWGWSRDLSWGTNGPKKLDPTQNYNFFHQNFLGVIKWYGYGSIRTDLIKLSRPVLDRFEEKKIKRFIKIAINNYKNAIKV